MKIYARRSHSYLDRATHTEYYFPERGWIDVPDYVGQLVVATHPDKLVDISEMADPEDAIRSLTSSSEPETDIDKTDHVVEAAAEARRPGRPRQKTTPLGHRGRGR